VQSGVADWLMDPAAGQPVIKPEPEDLTVTEELREVVLILKLARRFARQPSSPVQPRIVEFRGGRVEEMPALPPVETPSLDLAALYRRLVSAPQPWATLDTDGTLLLSSDRERLEEVFNRRGRRLRTLTVDEHKAVEVALPTGETFVAWLEDDPKNPRRPIAHIKRPPVNTPEVEPPEEKPVAAR
jgi:hypothetical protein